MPALLGGPVHTIPRLRGFSDAFHVERSDRSSRKKWRSGKADWMRCHCRSADSCRRVNSMTSRSCFLKQRLGCTFIKRYMVEKKRLRTIWHRKPQRHETLEQLDTLSVAAGITSDARVWKSFFYRSQNRPTTASLGQTAPDQTEVHKSIFSQPLKEKYISEVLRIGSIIAFHLSKLWKAKFFIQCNVMFLVRLQGKFEIDHS